MNEAAVAAAASEVEWKNDSANRQTDRQLETRSKLNQLKIFRICEIEHWKIIKV